MICFPILKFKLNMILIVIQATAIQLITGPRPSGPSLPNTLEASPRAASLLITDQYTIPAVRLTCIACFGRFLSQFSTDFHEILYGPFASHSATTVKFSSENIV